MYVNIALSRDEELSDRRPTADSETRLQPVNCVGKPSVKMTWKLAPIN